MMAKILIVDDDDMIRDTLYDLLEVDHVCETAETAEKALALLEAAEFDLVLTDISMPGLSGRELLNRVLQKYPQTPVIIISGHTDEDHAQSLLELGAFDYVLKPFRLEVIEQGVRKALERQHDAHVNVGDRRS